MATVFSNHKNLTYFRTAQKLNDRQARWSFYLSEFDIKLIHLPGTQMVQSDALSQRPDHGIDESTGREEQTLLPDNMLINLMDVDLQEWILNSSDKMTDIKATLETIMKEGLTNLQNNLANWKIEDVDGRKTIFYKEKNYIPNDQESRCFTIMKQLDILENSKCTIWLDNIIGGQDFKHLSRPTYIQGCGICQQFKINRFPSHPAYQPIEGAKMTRPFANCSMDLITDLPPIKGYDSILVMVNQGLSKGVILCPCAKTITWEGISELLQDNLSKRFRLLD